MNGKQPPKQNTYKNSQNVCKFHPNCYLMKCILILLTLIKKRRICTHLLIPFSKLCNPLTYSISITLQLRVKQELENYERYAQTTEGEKRIHDSFASKLEQIDSAYPFIEQLTDMYQQFCNETISKEERAVLGSALLYFILSTDIIPDYLFPIGYLDDAIAVELAREKLIEMKRKT